jgi:hypothetical protein
MFIRLGKHVLSLLKIRLYNWSLIIFKDLSLGGFWFVLWFQFLFFLHTCPYSASLKEICLSFLFVAWMNRSNKQIPLMLTNFHRK